MHILWWICYHLNLKETVDGVHVWTICWDRNCPCGRAQFEDLKWGHKIIHLIFWLISKTYLGRKFMTAWQHAKCITPCLSCLLSSFSPGTYITFFSNLTYHVEHDLTVAKYHESGKTILAYFKTSRFFKILITLLDMSLDFSDLCDMVVWAVINDVALCPMPCGVSANFAPSCAYFQFNTLPWFLASCNSSTFLFVKYGGGAHCL